MTQFKVSIVCINDLLTSQQTMKTNLSANGYSHQWKLFKTTQIPSVYHENSHLDFFDKINNQIKKPTSHHLDLIVPNKIRTSNENYQLDQFLHIIGTPLPKESIPQTTTKTNPLETNPKFERNDDKRAFRIQEFIKTEQSYVKTLQTLIKYTVNPLKSVMHRKNCILNTFKCTKIFLNIDQIVSANQDFLKDLIASEPFGLTCQKHMKSFECYRKYLLEQSEAQKLHSKEVKSNQAYRRFLLKTREHPEFEKKRLQDILVEPVQRISRYSMMLREILNLTPREHPDYPGLQAACEQSRIIATMDDDHPTRTATMLLSLYQAIKESPCSLVNQNRSFITHLDALEIHPLTNKPQRAVSLFLFTDKILIASRLDSKDLDIHELLHTETPTLFSKLASKREGNLRFQGWADVQTIDLFDGLSDRPSSFILSAIQESTDTTASSFEQYFYKGPRIFVPSNDSLQKSLDFKQLYQKTRALLKETEYGEMTFSRTWNGIPTFTTLYTPESYTRVKNKSECALLYVDHNLSLDLLFPLSLVTPYTVGLIHPEDMKGFRLNLCTKAGFADRYRSTDRLGQGEPTLDFESIFWNNVHFLNQCTRASEHYLPRRLQPDISRAASIPTLGKLFSSSDGVVRVSTSYDRIPQAKSLPHMIHADIPKRVQVHSWNGVPTNLYPEKKSTCDDLLLTMMQERNRLLHDQEHDAKHDTLSSRGSGSSFSMIDDDEVSDLDTINSHLPVAKVNIKTSHENLDSVFQSIRGFDGEMQLEWKQLMSKYELLCGTDMHPMIQSVHYQLLDILKQLS